MQTMLNTALSLWWETKNAVCFSCAFSCVAVQQLFAVSYPFVFLCSISLVGLKSFGVQINVTSVHYGNDSPRSEHCHTYETHKKNQDLLCRICGERASKQTKDRKGKLCSNFVSDIFCVFNLNIRHDEEDTHPDKLCLFCCKRLINARRYKGRVTDYIPCDNKEEYSAIDRKWVKWDAETGFADCWSWSIVASQVQGVRPKKRKRVIRNEKSPEKRKKKHY